MRRPTPVVARSGMTASPEPQRRPWRRIQRRPRGARALGALGAARQRRPKPSDTAYHSPLATDRLYTLGRLLLAACYCPPTSGRRVFAAYPRPPVLLAAHAPPPTTARPLLLACDWPPPARRLTLLGRPHRSVQAGDRWGSHFAAVVPQRPQAQRLAEFSAFGDLEKED